MKDGLLLMINAQKNKNPVGCIHQTLEGWNPARRLGLPYYVFYRSCRNVLEEKTVDTTYVNATGLSELRSEFLGSQSW